MTGFTVVGDAQPFTPSTQGWDVAHSIYFDLEMTTIYLYNKYVRSSSCALDTQGAVTIGSRIRKVPTICMTYYGMYRDFSYFDLKGKIFSFVNFFPCKL